MHTPAPLLPFLFAATTAAQAVVLPAHFTVVEGTGSSTLPFGFATLPVRYLQVHDGVPATTMTSLAFRHDTSGALRAPFQLTVDVYVSTAAAPAAATSATFDANHGADKVHVVTSRTLTVPGNDPAQLPGPFLLDLSFDAGVQFVFGGGSLCWEVVVTANSSTSSVPFDSVLTQGASPSSPGMLGTHAGIGCLATGRTQPMALGPANSPVDWANGQATLVVSASQLQANGLVAWALGSNIVSWAGVPLPLSLPTSLGAPSGECRLYTDPLVVTPAVASAFGGAQLQLVLPVSLALHGATVPTQVLGLDAAANPLGITSSNVVVQQLCAPYAANLGVQRVYAVGGTPAIGTVDANNPLIVRCQ